MTVIDQVLQAEKASEEKLTEAKVTAAATVAAAHKNQAQTLSDEKARLAEVEKNELAAHANQVEKSAQEIVQKAEVAVKAVEDKFAQKSASLVNKIKDALS